MSDEELRMFSLRLLVVVHLLLVETFERVSHQHVGETWRLEMRDKLKELERML